MVSWIYTSGFWIWNGAEVSLREYVISECNPESLSVATTVMTSDPGGMSSARMATYPPTGIMKTG